mgnify:CR=1 FL=1
MKPPILENKAYGEEPVFRPANLLREARRQKNKPNCNVPEICVLDPDGDLVDYLKEQGMATRNECWACYHSELYSFRQEGRTIGILPCVVGAPYATIVAEQLFVSGCSLVVSVTSAGIINEEQVTHKFALITESVRDEGTSYHYLPPEDKAGLNTELYKKLSGSSVNDSDALYFEGKSWTTDAPYRETQSAIEAMKEQGVTCVEMESAALYAVAGKTGNDVICFAHLTNTMAQNEGDFEKGESFGSLDTLELLSQVIKTLDY